MGGTYLVLELCTDQCPCLTDGSITFLGTPDQDGPFLGPLDHVELQCLCLGSKDFAHINTHWKTPMALCPLAD